MKKIEKLIKELQATCDEEGFNMIAAATKTGENNVTIAMTGDLPELVILIANSQNEISEETGLPYELVEMIVAENYGKEEEQKEND